MSARRGRGGQNFNVRKNSRAIKSEPNKFTAVTEKKTSKQGISRDIFALMKGIDNMSIESKRKSQVTQKRYTEAIQNELSRLRDTKFIKRNFLYDKEKNEFYIPNHDICFYVPKFLLDNYNVGLAQRFQLPSLSHFEKNPSRDLALEELPEKNIYQTSMALCPVQSIDLNFQSITFVDFLRISSLNEVVRVDAANFTLSDEEKKKFSGFYNSSDNQYSCYTAHCFDVLHILGTEQQSPKFGQNTFHFEDTKLVHDYVYTSNGKITYTTHERCVIIPFDDPCYFDEHGIPNTDRSEYVFDHKCMQIQAYVKVITTTFELHNNSYDISSVSLGERLRQENTNTLLNQEILISLNYAFENNIYCENIKKTALKIVTANLGPMVHKLENLPSLSSCSWIIGSNLPGIFYTPKEKTQSQQMQDSVQNYNLQSFGKTIPGEWVHWNLIISFLRMLRMCLKTVSQLQKKDTKPPSMRTMNTEEEEHWETVASYLFRNQSFPSDVSMATVTEKYVRALEKNFPAFINKRKLDMSVESWIHPLTSSLALDTSKSLIYENCKSNTVMTTTVFGTLADNIEQGQIWHPMGLTFAKRTQDNVRLDVMQVQKKIDEDDLDMDSIILLASMPSQFDDEI